MVLTDRIARNHSTLDALSSVVPRGIRQTGLVLEQHVREGRFQRGLALITALSSLLSGLEVAYEHYRGSYGQQIMYTPVILSGALGAASIWTIFSRRAARVALPLVSLLTVLDGLAGFYFHVRGVARKPGGWRIPVMNVIMGPPVFAPLLFAVSGYLGLITSFLRREDDPDGQVLGVVDRSRPSVLAILPRRVGREGLVLEQQVREGRFQKQIAVAAALAALFSGLEALYSHYKNNFRYGRSQWSPIVLTPVMMAAGFGTVWSRTVARTMLPAASILCLLDGTVGFYFHARGIVRRPGGLRVPMYNTIYGPPIFAPLLFAASGFMGVLASLLRRGDG